MNKEEAPTSACTEEKGADCQLRDAVVGRKGIVVTSKFKPHVTRHVCYDAGPSVDGVFSS